MSSTLVNTDTAKISKAVSRLLSAYLTSKTNDERYLPIVESQLLLFFTELGVTTDDTLILFAHRKLPKPNMTVLPEKGKVDFLKEVEHSLLQMICDYLLRVRNHGYYLGDKTTMKDLSTFSTALRSHPSRYDACGSVEQDSGVVSDRKIPAFTVPKFTGDRLDGSDYIKKVERVFKNHGIAEFLWHEHKSTVNPDWSTAFASRILDSLADSEILSFLAERYKNETSCYVVWMKVKAHLTSEDLTVQRCLKYWTEFMGLRCSELTEFLPFYNRVTQVLEKLKDAKSVAVTDDMFLRAYLAKAISCEELQTETKKLLQHNEESYDTILQDVLTDYRSQETGTVLRDGDVIQVPRKIRRAEKSARGSNPSSTAQRPKFPVNKGNLIPHSYYTQIKEWYEVMVIPEQQRSPEESAKLQAFKWKHTQPKYAKGSNSNRSSSAGARYDGHGRGRDPKRSRRSRRRQRSPSSTSDSSYSSRNRQRRSRRSSRASSRRSSRSRSRSRSKSRSYDRGEGRDGSQSMSSSATATVARRRVMFGNRG